jgi:hypothetical protein
MVHVYDASDVTSLVLDFYNDAWQSVISTRRVFEQIGLALTRAAFRSVPLLQDLKLVDSIYAGPIARAGCGLFRPSVVDLLVTWCTPHDITINSFGLGLRRGKNPLHTPATIYWNTLQLTETDDLTRSVILIYEMGEATGSTITGVVTALQDLNIPSENMVFLIGAACIEQTRARLELWGVDACSPSRLGALRFWHDRPRFGDHIYSMGRRNSSDDPAGSKPPAPRVVEENR